MNKEQKQKNYLDRLIRNNVKYHENETVKRNKDTIDNLLDWNKQNLSPTGGKKAFVKTQKEQMAPKPRGGFLTKK